MYWHNTTWRSSTEFTPYEIMYGWPPPAILQYVPRTAKVQSVEEHLYDRDRVKKLLMDNLVKARERKQLYADRHCTKHQFEVGDWVLLKLQPYKQKLAQGATPQKLSSRYYGPYLVLEEVGTVAYCLQIPPSAKIHDTFHVSQLKKYASS